MERIILALERMAPEALETAKLRYRILREVSHHQPVGRRHLADRLGITERAARGEVECLRQRGALESSAAGLSLTPEGEELLREMDDVIYYLDRMHLLAQALKNKYGLDDVLVAPGDSYHDLYAKKDLGRIAASYLSRVVFDGCLLAVTGGTSLKEMARAMERTDVHAQGVLVLPARGGLGEDVEDQANSIAATIARAIGASYRLLHVPDNLGPDVVAKLMEDKKIAEMVSLIKSADILVYGIGSAIEMANRRGISEDGIKVLEDKEGVGEAFRYYFNDRGEIVYSLPGIGLELADLDGIKTLIAIAGGSNKARAISAVLSARRGGVLITDEGAARAILGKEVSQ